MTQELDFYFFRGRVAAHAILKTLGIGPGDEVAIQAFTCVAVPAPILMTGAKPVYVDIDANTYNLNVDALESAVSSRTRAVIVQHTFGIPADMDAVLSLARRRGIVVIEDCCHTLGSSYRNQRVGTIGEAAFFSHRWGKPIVLGAGGRAVVRGERLCSEFAAVCATSQPESTLKALRTVLEFIGHQVVLRPSMFWFVRDVFRALSKKGLVVPTFGEEEMKGLMVDAGKRIPSLHVGWLARLLSKVDEDIELRRSVAAKYRDVLSALGARTYSVGDACDPVLLRYPILVENRNGVVEKARKSRIELGDWFHSPVHPLMGRQDLAKIGYELGSCKVAEMVSNQIVTLPIDRRIRPSYLTRTIDFLHDISRAGLLAPPPHFSLVASGGRTVSTAPVAY